MNIAGGTPAAMTSSFVTVIIDLIPVAQGTGPARLLDMVEGRSKQVFKRWLSARPAAWRTGAKIEGDGWVHRLQDRRRRRAP